MPLALDMIREQLQYEITIAYFRPNTSVIFTPRGLFQDF
jgi:hypothetical protein